MGGMASMLNCIHLIPADGLGGVEVAARSYLKSASADGDLDLKIMYLSSAKRGLDCDIGGHPKTIWAPFSSLNNPFNFLWALRAIFRSRPDVLICSLWRTMPLGVLYKLLHPAKKLVCFLHSTENAHAVDQILNAAAMFLSNAIWTDSPGTMRLRVPQWLKARRKQKVISFVLRQYHPPRFPVNSPSFVFWGRLDYQKGIDRALRLFALVAQKQQRAEFFIYGPDGGYAPRLRALASELGVADRVRFMGITSFDRLKEEAPRFSFYLQLSRIEGMALSVVEAMQLGLIPVVSAVGEIPNYCHSGNSILIDNKVDDYSEAASTIIETLRDDEQYRKLQKNAAGRWGGSPTYDADVIYSLKELCGCL
jgi:glycosyltransferase involved in cell wall biosynthesis